MGLPWQVGLPSPEGLPAARWEVLPRHMPPKKSASNTMTSNQAGRRVFIDFSFREESESAENLPDPGKVTIIGRPWFDQITGVERGLS